MSTREIKPGDTQVISLEDVDVSAIALESERKLPPPLPPEVPSPSIAPSMPPPAPKRGTGFYVALVVGFVVVGVGFGLVAAFAFGGKPAPAPASSQGVITIPTIEMDDAPDATP